MISATGFPTTATLAAGFSRDSNVGGRVAPFSTRRFRVLARRTALSAVEVDSPFSERTNSGPSSVETKARSSAGNSATGVAKNRGRNVPAETRLSTKTAELVEALPWALTTTATSVWVAAPINPGAETVNSAGEAASTR